jgi:hypothetical protein
MSAAIGRATYLVFAPAESTNAGKILAAVALADDLVAKHIPNLFTALLVDFVNQTATNRLLRRICAESLGQMLVRCSRRVGRFRLPVRVG